MYLHNEPDNSAWVIPYIKAFSASRSEERLLIPALDLIRRFACRVTIKSTTFLFDFYILIYFFVIENCNEDKIFVTIQLIKWKPDDI